MISEGIVVLGQLSSNMTKKIELRDIKNRKCYSYDYLKKLINKQDYKQNLNMLNYLEDSHFMFLPLTNKKIVKIVDKYKDFPLILGIFIYELENYKKEYYIIVGKIEDVIESPNLGVDLFGSERAKYISIVSCPAVYKISSSQYNKFIKKLLKIYEKETGKTLLSERGTFIDYLEFNLLRNNILNEIINVIESSLGDIYQHMICNCPDKVLKELINYIKSGEYNERLRCEALKRLISTLSNIEDIDILIISALLAGNAVLLVGPPGTGKTSFARCASLWLTDELNVEITPWIVSIHGWFSRYDLIGGYEITSKGNRWKKGVLIKALEEGNKLLILDEINRGEADKFMAELFLALSQGGRLFVPELNRTYNLFDKKVFIIATANTADSTLLSPLGFALLRRFVTFKLTINYDEVENLFELIDLTYLASLLDDDEYDPELLVHVVNNWIGVVNKVKTKIDTMFSDKEKARRTFENIVPGWGYIINNYKLLRKVGFEHCKTVFKTVYYKYIEQEFLTEEDVGDIVEFCE